MRRGRRKKKEEKKKNGCDREMKTAQGGSKSWQGRAEARRYAGSEASGVGGEEAEVSEDMKRIKGKRRKDKKGPTSWHAKITDKKQQSARGGAGTPKLHWVGCVRLSSLIVLCVTYSYMLNPFLRHAPPASCRRESRRNTLRQTIQKWHSTCCHSTGKELKRCRLSTHQTPRFAFYIADH